MPQRSEFGRTKAIEIRAFADLPLDDVFGIEPWDLRTDLTDIQRMIALIDIRNASRDAMCDSERIGWYALHVEIGAERKVRTILSKGCINHYLPVHPDITTARRGNHRNPKVRLGGPVCPGYVFFQCGFHPRAFVGMEAIPGVFEVLGGKAAPARIPDANMRDFMALIADGHAVDVEASHEPMAGDDVFIKAGPWADFRGKVITVDEKRCLSKVEVSLYGRVTTVRMPLAYLEKM